MTAVQLWHKNTLAGIYTTPTHTYQRTCVYALSSCGLMWPRLQYLAAENVNRDSGSSSVNTLNTASRMSPSSPAADLVLRKS